MRINKDIRNIILKRLFISLGLLLVIRIGTFIPVPGINLIDLAVYLQTHTIANNLVNTFSGDNTFVIGLFTLNIYPSINSAIFVQLLIASSPQLSKIQKEGDLEGRRKINRLTRFGTLFFAVFQSLSISFLLKQIVYDWSYLFAIEIIIWLTTGAMIVLWLSELITDFGLGNGSSLLICVNIVTNLPNLYNILTADSNGQLSLFKGLEIFTIISISLYGIVFLQEGLRMIPLISSKSLNQPPLQFSAAPNNYIPLRLNQAGVMPIILSTSILVAPRYLSNLGLIPNINLGLFYWVLYFILIFVFSSFYSTIVLNPKDLSDQLQRTAVAIPGVRPGVHTTFYLKQLLRRLTLIGATMLAVLTIVPNFVESVLNLTSFNGLSTTSLLIITGVAIDLIREVNNIYYSNVYNDMYQ